ncbi:MAG: TspO/MBR family protein [Rhodoblastus sp.]
MGEWGPYIVAGLIALVVELLGGWLTVLGPWYANLRKPSWQPPGWAFGPAWTILFVMIAISGGMVWTHASPQARPALLVLFGVNAVLNVAWSGLFFRARRPDLAFAEVIVFWLSIAALIFGVWPHSQTAALLLVPYLAWVAFAGYLNWTVARLNAYL